MTMSKLDFPQVIKSVYDEGTESLRVTGGTAATTVEVENVPGESLNVNVTNALVTEPYDQVDLTYVAAGNGAGEVETATYKLATVTVATLTLTYNGDNKLSSVVRS